jgi:hypothetical protein
MGGPATRTDLTRNVGQDDENWDDVEDYPMNPFVVEPNTDGGDAN